MNNKSLRGTDQSACSVFFSFHFLLSASTPIKEALPASAAEYYGTQPANEDLPLNQADKVQEWLANFAIENGIYIPNKHELLLPFDLEPQVYKRMKTDLGGEGPIEGLFYQVLKRKFPRYKIYDVGYY